MESLLIKVRANDFVNAGGMLKQGMKLTKAYVSNHPVVTLVRFDNSFNCWIGNDSSQDVILELEYTFIELNVHSFTIIEK